MSKVKCVGAWGRYGLKLRIEWCLGKLNRNATIEIQASQSLTVFDDGFNSGSPPTRALSMKHVLRALHANRNKAVVDT